jgi:DNA invertase Pin-like site-specific DNA recombinase
LWSSPSPARFVQSGGSYILPNSRKIRYLVRDHQRFCHREGLRLARFTRSLPTVDVCKSLPGRIQNGEAAGQLLDGPWGWKTTIDHRSMKERIENKIKRNSLPSRVREYLRTSSATNVGPDRDSDKRQRVAIAAFAKRVGLDIVGEFYDAAVSGADPIESRPGFAALLDRIESNGVRTVIVEDASRFARDLVTQELGILALTKRGVRLLTASGDDMTDTSDPSRIMMRQIAGSFAQYEKSRLVGKLRAARASGSASLRASAKGARRISNISPTLSRWRSN